MQGKIQRKMAQEHDNNLKRILSCEKYSIKVMVEDKKTHHQFPGYLWLDDNCAKIHFEPSDYEDYDYLFISLALGKRQRYTKHD